MLPAANNSRTDAPMDPMIMPWTGERFDFSRAKWTWSCRHLLRSGSPDRYVLLREPSKPQVADAVLVQVDRVGRHGRIDTEQGGRLQIYTGDHLVCAFGNRYATDVYEGRVRGLKRLHLLAGSGVVGTVVARHRDVRRPTAISFLGYVGTDAGARVNTKDLLFNPVLGGARPDLILVVGTGMNTGKTTVTRKILRGLVTRGIRAAGCKITGTTSPRDLRAFAATGAAHAMDFSDWGWPSTYGATSAELHQLLDMMLEAGRRKGTDVVVMEIADGFLQRETQLLLHSEPLRALTRGVVLSAACSGSALAAAEHLKLAGFDVWAVTGLMTNSPLFMREVRRQSAVPVVGSSAGADRLINTVLKRLESIRVEVPAKASND